MELLFFTILTPFELRVAIEALNAKRLNQKASGIDNTV